MAWPDCARGLRWASGFAGEDASLWSWHAADHRTGLRETASLKVKTLVAERRAIKHEDPREHVRVSREEEREVTSRARTNFFMMEVGRPGTEFAKEMADNKVIIGRVWPAWPTKVRVTVGTQEEMDKFKAAYTKIMG